MLVSNGDCLMATVLAKQIKKDFPGAELTWAISNFCRPMIENNPYVDKIWEIALSSKQAGLNEEWHSFRKEAMKRKEAGEFDEAFFTQIYPDNVSHFDGSTRGTIYGAYPYPVTVDARPVLQLTSAEKNKVREYVTSNNFEKFTSVILMECSSFSGQSFVDSAWALKVAHKLVNEFEDLAIVVSTHENLNSDHKRILIANSISLRENVELSHYCSLLVGCSSGVTWSTVSEEAKRLPMVQFLNRVIGFSFASVVYDHERWSLSTADILETTNPSIEDAVKLISFVLKNGIGPAKERYHQQLRPRDLSMLKYAFMFLRKGSVSRSLGIIKRFTKRKYLGKGRS